MLQSLGVVEKKLFYRLLSMFYELDRKNRKIVISLEWAMCYEGGHLKGSQMKNLMTIKF